MNQIVKNEPDKVTLPRRPSVVEIILVWFVASVLCIITTAPISGEILGMSVISPISTSLLAAAFSILHPGGWLGIAGLILTLKTRRYRWLTLAVIGAICTGVTVPFLEGIGAMNL